MLDGDPPRRLAELGAGARGGRASSPWSLSARSSESPVSKLARCRSSGGYASSSPWAISSSPECRATSGGQPAAAASAATIPNASGKIDGTTVDVRERDQVDEVAVLERAGEERPRRRDPLQLVAVVAEADDDRARVHAAQRLEQHVDALVVEELPEVEDGRRVAGEELGEPRGVALVRQPLLAVARVRRVGAALLQQRRERLARAARATNSSTSTPGGTSWTRSTWPTTSSSTSRMCAEPTKTASRAAQRRGAPSASSSAFPRIEYSSSEPCALTANRAPVAAATGAAHQHVVREDEVGRKVRSQRPRR